MTAKSRRTLAHQPTHHLYKLVLLFAGAESVARTMGHPLPAGCHRTHASCPPPFGLSLSANILAAKVSGDRIVVCARHKLGEL